MAFLLSVFVLAASLHVVVPLALLIGWFAGGIYLLMAMAGVMYAAWESAGAVSDISGAIYLIALIATILAITTHAELLWGMYLLMPTSLGTILMLVAFLVLPLYVSAIPVLQWATNRGSR